MNWLEAALAFSLIMLALATVVTIVLETGYQVLSTRERGFRLMMERLFDDVLSKRIAATLGSVSMEEARAQFLAAVTRNQAYSQKTSWLRSIAQSADLKSMTMMQFAERLADTHVGRAIADAGTERVHIVINDLSQKFDRFGQGASQRFQGHAHFWCLLVSLLCAFVANVDAVLVFKSLLHDDLLTTKVIQGLGSQVDENAPRPKSATEAMTAAPVPADAANSTPKEVIDAGAARVRAELSKINDTGLPISSEYWPFCRPASAGEGKPAPVSRDARCFDEHQAAVTTDFGSTIARILSIRGLKWILSVGLAGLLIGLGAPFWFDLARSLTRGAQSRSGSREPETVVAPARPAGVVAASPPGTPVDAFRVAIAAARPLIGRALLSPDGQPVRGAVQ